MCVLIGLLLGFGMPMHVRCCANECEAEHRSSLRSMGGFCVWGCPVSHYAGKTQSNVCCHRVCMLFQDGHACR